MTRWTPDGPLDLTEAAHLRDARGFSPSLRRYAPPAALGDVVRRFWVPVWSLPDGEVSVQRVLQYPVCQASSARTAASWSGRTAGSARRSSPAAAGWSAP
ncbi:hypothetical protein [Pimelobacter simplex]|uniref:hypothetical protein n=1 Tax=Nocardioides simplex TaxID=2045 RepID=UPI001C207A1C|nr:hypothetical protein [Pimelobacter simplex]